MRKIYEVFDVSFYCDKDIERCRFRYKGLVLVVQARNRTGKLRIDIRGLTPDRIGTGLFEVQRQMMVGLDREKAREIVQRVFEVLRKELTVDESAVVTQYYRQARISATSGATGVVSMLPRPGRLGKIIKLFRPRDK